MYTICHVNSYAGLNVHNFSFIIIFSSFCEFYSFFIFQYFSFKTLKHMYLKIKMSKEFNEEVDIGEDSRSKCELLSEWNPSAHMLLPSRRKPVTLSQEVVY